MLWKAPELSKNGVPKAPTHFRRPHPTKPVQVPVQIHFACCFCAVYRYGIIVCVIMTEPCKYGSVIGSVARVAAVRYRVLVSPCNEPLTT